MKKAILALATTLSILQSEATVRRVNNTAGSAAPYSNLQTAINASSAGDTIYVEGSTTDYGYITVSKKLQITGSGYFLNETTPNPRTQANTAPSTIPSITFGPGSKGSVLQGFSVNGIALNDSLITIQRNKIAGTINFAQNNSTAFDTVRNNFLSSYMAYNNGTTTATGLIIYNNIFTYSYILEVNASNLNLVSGYFINNSFPLGGNTFKCVGFVFQNNIFGSGISFNGYLSSNSFFNNVTSSANGLPSGNNNVLNANGNLLYRNTTSTPVSTDGGYQLQASSPAIGAGLINNAAVDCGAFGGPAPYVHSGMPAIPSIYSLSAPSQVTFGTSSINVTLSAAAH